MTDETNSTDQGGDAGATQGGQQALQIVINAQYLKDLSFENPNAPQSLVGGQQQPKIEMAVDVAARGIGENVAEVALTLRAQATQADRTAFIAEVVYAGVISYPPIPQEQAKALVLIEGPRLLFPFARQILATVVQQGGFPPLMLQPIDFVDIFRRQAMNQLSAADAPQGTA